MATLNYQRVDLVNRIHFCYACPCCDSPSWETQAAYVVSLLPIHTGELNHVAKQQTAGLDHIPLCVHTYVYIIIYICEQMDPCSGYR